MYPIKKTGIPFSVDLSPDVTITYSDYTAVLTNVNDNLTISQVFNDLGIAEFTVSYKGVYSLSIENYLTDPVSIIVSDSNIRDLEQTIVDTNTYVQGLQDSFSTVLSTQLQTLSSQLSDIETNMQDNLILTAVQGVVTDIKDSTLAIQSHTTTEIDRSILNHTEVKEELQESLNSTETNIAFKLGVIHDLVSYIKTNMSTTSEESINSILEIVTYLSNNTNTSLDEKILNVQAMLEGKEYTTLASSDISTESSIGLREIWDNLTLEHNVRIDEILALVSTSKEKILQAEMDTSVDLSLKLEEIKTIVTNVANIDHSALDIKEILDKNYLETAVGNVGISNQVESVSLLLHDMNNALKGELKSIDSRLENINTSILSKKDELSEEILALGGTDDENNVANLNLKLDTIISDVDTRSTTLEDMIGDSTVVETAIESIRLDISDLDTNISVNNMANVDTLTQIIEDTTNIKQSNISIDSNVKTVKTNTNTIITDISDNSSGISKANSSLTDMENSLGLIKVDVANSRSEMVDVTSAVITVSETVTTMDENVGNTLVNVGNSLDNVNAGILEVETNTKAIVDRMGSSFDVITNSTWDIDSDQNIITVVAPEDSTIRAYIKASGTTDNFSILHANFEVRSDGTYVTATGCKRPFVADALLTGDYIIKVSSGSFEVLKKVTVVHFIQESNELKVLTSQSIVSKYDSIKMFILSDETDSLLVQEKTEEQAFKDTIEVPTYVNDGMFSLTLKRTEGDYIFKIINNTNGKNTLLKVTVGISSENAYAQNTNKKVTAIKNSLSKIGL